MARDLHDDHHSGQYGNQNGRRYSHRNGNGNGNGNEHGRGAAKQTSNNHASQNETLDSNTNGFSVQGGVGGGGKLRRTLFITGIPKDAEYCDLVGVIRGGPIVDVWMNNSVGPLALPGIVHF